MTARQLGATVLGGVAAGVVRPCEAGHSSSGAPSVRAAAMSAE